MFAWSLNCTHCVQKIYHKIYLVSRRCTFHSKWRVNVGCSLHVKHGLLRYTLSIKTGMGGQERTPVVSISNVLYCFRPSFGHECLTVLTEQRKGKISAFKAHTVTRRKAAHYHHGISANNGEFRSRHSECYIKCNYTWYFRMCCTA